MKLFSLMCLLVLNYNSRAQQPDYSYSESYKVAKPAQLLVNSRDGNIEISPSDENSIQVRYIVKKENAILKISRAETEKQVIMEITPGANSLTINIKYPKELRPLDAKNRLTVSLKIYVPKQTVCDLKTSDGNIVVNGLLSNQQLQTSDGNILVSDVKGSVKGYTSDGNIMAKEIVGSVDFKTSDGNISLNEVEGNEISLMTSDGHIEFDRVKGSITAITSDGSINGNVIELKKRLSARTSDGNITIAIPERLGLNLDIKGSAVNTPLKNFSGTSGRKSIRGQLNGGGIPIELKATDGNINLTYR